MELSILSSILPILSEAAQRLLCDRTVLSQTVELKVDGSSVCQADLETGKFVSHALHCLTPNIPILCEETAENSNISLRAPLLWVLDPLDGTDAYVREQDTFGIMLALLKDGIPEAGWILCPARNWQAWGWRSRGGNILQIDGIVTSTVQEPRELSAIRATIASGDFEPKHATQVNRFTSKLARVDGTASCAIDYIEFLAGWRDILLYRRSLPWDHASGVCLSSIAGADIKRFDSSPVCFGDTNEGLIIARSQKVSTLCARLLP